MVSSFVCCVVHSHNLCDAFAELLCQTTNRTKGQCATPITAFFFGGGVDLFGIVVVSHILAVALGALGLAPALSTWNQKQRRGEFHSPKSLMSFLFFCKHCLESCGIRTSHFSVLFTHLKDNQTAGTCSFFFVMVLLFLQRGASCGQFD